LEFSIISTLPEAFSTAFTAPAEALSTFTFILDFNSPLAINFTASLSFSIIHLSSKTFLSISVTPVAAKSSKSLKVIKLYFFLKAALEKPLNFGILLNKGVCPHSNRAGTHPPALEFCPFAHLQHIAHFPEPTHLPSLFEVFLEPDVDLMLFSDNIVN
jgi:hypothetical protein